MIEWISQWAEAIIIAVIIATIIEMILPEGNNKKYIKVVTGIYILFTIISPIITNVTGKSLVVSDILDLQQYIDEVKEKETSQNMLQLENETNVKDIYITNLKTDIKNKLKERGYIVANIDIEIEDNANYTLKKITLNIQSIEQEDKEENVNTQIQSINEVDIYFSNSEELQENTVEIKNSEKNKIKEYISSVYEINEKNIIIK